MSEGPGFGKALGRGAANTVVGVVGTAEAAMGAAQKAVGAAGKVVDASGNIATSVAKATDTVVEGTGVAVKVADSAATLLDQVSQGTGDVTKVALKGTARTLGPLTDTVALIANMPGETLRSSFNWFKKRNRKKVVEGIINDIQELFNQDNATPQIKNTYVAWALQAALDTQLIEDADAIKIIQELIKISTNNGYKLDINEINEELQKVRQFFNDQTGGNHHHKKHTRKKKNHTRKKKKHTRKKKKHTRKKKKNTRKKKYSKKLR